MSCPLTTHSRAEIPVDKKKREGYVENSLAQSDGSLSAAIDVLRDAGSGKLALLDVYDALGLRLNDVSACKRLSNDDAKCLLDAAEARSEPESDCISVQWCLICAAKYPSLQKVADVC